MQIVNNYNILDNKPIVATIGFFDGVHIGHRFLIEQVNQEARQHSLSSAVITFPVHPRKILQSDYQPALLCGYDEKIARLSSLGLDYCVPLNFSVEISQMSAFQFMQEVLKEKLNVDTLLIGYDHRFGHNREDSFEDYKQYGEEIGINVIQAKEYDGGEHISSSRIRSLLGEGNVTEAARLLSYNYTISGKIVEGFKVGRTIGFPTANIETWERYKVIPAYGIYAVYVYIDNHKYEGMLYIGNRPTLHNGQNTSVEVNLFDFDGNLYNKDLTAEFLEFVRADEKFSDIETLRLQIQQDKESVKAIIKRIQSV